MKIYPRFVKKDIRNVDNCWVLVSSTTCGMIILRQRFKPNCGEGRMKSVDGEKNMGCG